MNVRVGRSVEIPLVTGRDVYILDFSFKRPVMESLVSKNRAIVDQRDGLFLDRVDKGLRYRPENAAWNAELPANIRPERSRNEGRSLK